MQSIKLKHLSDGVVLLIANVIVNATNYGLNLALARWLGPDGFSEANIIASMVMIFSFAGMGIQLTIAKLTAESSLKMRKELAKVVGKYSMLITILLLISTPIIAGYLQFSSSLSLYLIFAGLPLYILMSASRGYYQGKTEFKTLAYTYLIEVMMRLTITIGLLLILTSYKDSTAIVSLGFFLSFVMTYFMFKPRNLQINKTKVSLESTYKFLLFMSAYELSQILINYSDILLVKHYFDPTPAGQYASVALLGRAVFFATWIIVTMLFPKVIKAKKEGKAHNYLFWNSMAAVAAICLSIIVFIYYFDSFIISVAFGQAYNEIAGLLLPYAIFTSLFCAANVIVYYAISLDRYLPVFISIFIGIMQIIFINIYHASMAQIVYVQTVLMSAFLILMIIYQVCTTQLQWRPKKVTLLTQKLKSGF